MDGERLARMEEKLDSITVLLRRHEELLRKYDQLNIDVEVIKAKASSAWWTIVQMGTLTAAVASVVAWVVAEFRFRG